MVTIFEPPTASRCSKKESSTKPGRERRTSFEVRTRERNSSREAAGTLNLSMRKIWFPFFRLLFMVGSYFSQFKSTDLKIGHYKTVWPASESRPYKNIYAFCFAAANSAKVTKWPAASRTPISREP